MNLRAGEQRALDVESDDRDIRTELSLEAARRSVVARTDGSHQGNQVEAKTQMRVRVKTPKHS